MVANQGTITVAEDTEEDNTPPLPSEPGRVLFVRYLDEQVDDFEILDYDCDTACFWAQEGIGIGYLISDMVGLPDKPGHYIVHGITVSFTRGDGWSTDDDEDWEWTSIERLDDPIDMLP